MSATALASALGVPANRVTAIINGQRGVTADTALRLGRYFGMPAQFWTNLQQSFELQSAEIKSGDEIDRIVKPRGIRDAIGGADPRSSAGPSSRDLSEVSGTAANRPRVAMDREKLAAICRTNGIRKLAIFGSALRDDFDSESDIDFLAEFEPGKVPGLIGIAGIEIELSQLLGGRKADLRTAEDLSRYFRDRVMKDAKVQYERG